jgi:hypothetical protein
MRSELRIADLKNRAPARSRLMNVKVPLHVIEEIDRLAKGLGATKTAVVVALLNEGLSAAPKAFEGGRRR